MRLQARVVDTHLSLAGRALQFQQPTTSSMQKPLQRLPFALQLDMGWLLIRPCPHQRLFVLVPSNSNNSNSYIHLTHLCKPAATPTQGFQTRRRLMGIATPLRLSLLRCRSLVRVPVSLIRPNLCQKCQKFMTGRRRIKIASASRRLIVESKRRQTECNRRLWHCERRSQRSGN